MPRYIIIRVQKSRSIVDGVTPLLKSVRRAWGYYKKNFNRRLDKKWSVHIYPINHGRIWNFKDGKWQIGSWYGNHNSAEYRRRYAEAAEEMHKSRYKVKK